jgi:hypothetical protein
MTADELKASFARYRPQLEVVVFGVALMAIGAWVGVTAHRSRAMLAKDADVLQAQVARNERWRSEYRPPSAAEMEQWRQAESALGRLGVTSAERITVAQVVARAAEESGLSGVRVRFSVADTAAAAAAPVEQVGTHKFHPAPYRLVVSGLGPYDAFVRFVGSLPPSVSVQQLSSSRAAGGIVHQLVLSVIESVESNGSGSTAIRPGGDGAARGARRGARITPGD